MLHIRLRDMNANDLRANELRHELEIRQSLNIPMVRTAAGHLNELLAEERANRINPITAYPFTGHSETEYNRIEQRVDNLYNWCFDRLVGIHWLDASPEEVARAEARMLHYYYRLRRLNLTPIGRRARDLVSAVEGMLVMMAVVQTEDGEADRAERIDLEVSTRARTDVTSLVRNLEGRGNDTDTTESHVSGHYELAQDSGPEFMSTAQSHADGQPIPPPRHSPIHSPRRPPVPTPRRVENNRPRQAPRVLTDTELANQPTPADPGRDQIREVEREYRERFGHACNSIQHQRQVRVEPEAPRVSANRPAGNRRAPEATNVPRRESVPSAEQQQSRPRENAQTRQSRPPESESEDERRQNRNTRPNDQHDIRRNVQNESHDAWRAYQRQAVQREAETRRRQAEYGQHNRPQTQPQAQPAASTPRNRPNENDARFQRHNIDLRQTRHDREERDGDNGFQRPGANDRQPSAARTVQFEDTHRTARNHTRFTSHYGRGMTFAREANYDNTHEQMSLRRWLQNKDFNGDNSVDDKNYLTVETFMNRVRAYQTAQQVRDEVVLRNIALSLTGAAGKWWEGQSKYVATVDEFDQAIRSRFAPDTRDSKRIVAKFYSRRQETDEFLLDYIDDMYCLLERIPMGRVEEDEAVGVMVHGINDEYTPFFVTNCPQSLAELRKLCNDLVAKKERPRKRTTVDTKPTGQKFERTARRVVNWVKAAEEEMSANSEEDQEVAKMISYMEKGQSNSVKSNSVTRTPMRRVEGTLDHVIPFDLVKEPLGDKPWRCHNCLRIGHNLYLCPYKPREICWGCGTDGEHIDTCMRCKDKPNKPAQPPHPSKNERPHLASTN